MFTPLNVVIAIVVLLVVLVIYNLFFKKKSQDDLDSDTLYYDGQERPVLEVGTLMKQAETQQQGEEEFNLLKTQTETPQEDAPKSVFLGVYKEPEIKPQSDFFDGQVSEVLQPVSTVEQPTYKDTRTREEKLADTFYFHSLEFENAYRYTVAGRYVKDETAQNGYRLLLAYAIAGEGDTFSRKVGREVATPRLDDPTRTVEFIYLTSEELEVPAVTFNKYASTVVLLPAFSGDEISYHRGLMSNRDSYSPKNGAPTQEQQDELTEYINKVKAAKNNQFVCDVHVQSSTCLVCGKQINNLIIEEVSLLDIEKQAESTKVKDEVVETQTPPTQVEDTQVQPDASI